MNARPQPVPRASLPDEVYARVKADIAEFRLLPGDRFTESEVAARLGVSRTPVREALFRLQREGHVQVQFRSGWQVQPFDFAKFEHLYDLRMVLETTAVQRLCEGTRQEVDRSRLEALVQVWTVPASARVRSTATVSRRDEAFHARLVEAAGNPEIARVHAEVTERIRIIRRLDFTQQPRVDATYDEHAAILRAVLQRRGDEAARLLRSHIETSRAEVRRLTLHHLHLARQRRAR